MTAVQHCYQNNYKKIGASFIDGCLLHVVDRDMLLKIMAEHQKERKLSDLDLSDVEMNDLDFSGFELKNIIFNYFKSKEKEKKELFNINFQGCKIEKVSFAQCNFIRCNFDSSIEWGDTTINLADFFFCRFEYCRFKCVKIEIADFRYSKIVNCSMGHMHASKCDFYMTAFKGTTNFIDSKFTYCSITNAVFENHCIEMKNLDNLAQENYEIYSCFLMNYPNWQKLNPCASVSFLNKSEHAKKRKCREDGDNEQRVNESELKLESKQYISREAQQIYTVLSGIYNGKGLNHDSNEAYRKAKVNEMRYYLCSIKLEFKRHHYWDVMKYLWRLLNPITLWVLGYGYKWMPILFIGAIVVVTFGLYVYFVSNESKGILSEDMTGSMQNMISPVDNFKIISNKIIALIQSCIGILILGFLGFIFANRIRNNG